MKHFIRTLAESWESSLLFLSVSVVLTAILSFSAGGRILAWQWWVSVALTSFFIFVKDRKNWRSVIIEIGYLGLFLIVLWLVTNLTITYVMSPDAHRCHIPAIRMLILGWNPIYDVLPSKIEQVMDLPIDTYYYDHVISGFKAVWFFSAVVYKFTGAEFNLLMPIVLVMFVCVSITFSNVFSHLRWWQKMLSILLLLKFTPTFCCAVDSIEALSAIGLLIAMFDAVKNGRWVWMRLIAYSFWMISAKPNGLIHCPIIWLFFVIFYGWRCMRRICFAFCILILLLSISLFSPFATSWLNFGHPLYPRITGNQNYPAKNITDDFLIRNEDAAYMGHLGAWVNAFISSTVARSYYQIKTGRRTFMPESDTWTQPFEGFSASPGAPTHTGVRLLFVCMLALLFWKGRAYRFLGAVLVGASAALPTEMIGYMRYTPWLLCMTIFSVPIIVDMQNAVVRKIMMVCIAGALLCVLPMSILRLAGMIDNSFALKQIYQKNPPKVILCSFGQIGKLDKKEIRSYLGNLVLLQRTTPGLRNAEIVSYPLESMYAQLIRDVGVDLFYDRNFWVLSSSQLKRYSEYSTVMAMKKKSDVIKALPKFLMKTYFVTLPQSFVHSVRALFA